MATSRKTPTFQILVLKIAKTRHLYTIFGSAAVAVKFGEHSSGFLILGCHRFVLLVARKINLGVLWKWLARLDKAHKKTLSPAGELSAAT